MTIASNVIFILLIGIGSQWGAIGIAMAHVATPALLLIPNLWFAFAKSPVNISAFFRALRTPLTASVFMFIGLIAFRATVPGDGSLLALCSGFAFGAGAYLLGCVSLRVGRAEMNGLLADLGASLPRVSLGRWRRDPR
jgi:hypothetical protein